MIDRATEADLPAMLEIYRPYVENTTVSFEYTPPTPAEFARRFQAHRDFPWLVWRENGRVLGYAYAGRVWERAAYRWCAESSVYLAPEARRRGIGRGLVEALEQALRELGYRLLYAVITEENRDSIAFHEALGYVHRGTFPRCGWKFGRWLGVCWMEKRLLPADTPADFPKPWPDTEDRL